MPEGERLTKPGQSLCTFCEGIAFCKQDCENEARLARLIELENQIENKNLVSSQELLDKIDQHVDLLVQGLITDLEFSDWFNELKASYNFEVNYERYYPL